MGGRRGDISANPSQWGRPWHCGPARSTQHTARSKQHGQNQIRIRDKTGKTWYSGDASASERQGPWFAKCKGLSAIGIVQRQGRQASRFGCRSRLGGIGPAGPPFRERLSRAGE